MKIPFSTYLQGRRFNSQLLTKIGDEFVAPVIEKFNTDNDRKINAEWCMNAKYQSVVIFIKMDDGEDLSDEAINLICYGKLNDVLSEWFAAEADEEDCDNATYVSIDLGL